MCLAIPGKIIELDAKTATVQYPNETRKVLVDPNIQVKVGDYVLVQMQIIIEKVDEESAKASWEAWGEIK